VLRLEYADEARRDLVEIARYSRAEWGDAHARTFFQALETSIQQLAVMPRVGQPADEIRQGVRRLVFKTLTIYYALEIDSVRILAVLHGRQDAASALAARP
jgi:toxin ParE1/3/4